MKQFSKLLAIGMLAVLLVFSSCGTNRTVRGGAIGAGGGAAVGAGVGAIAGGGKGAKTPTPGHRNQIYGGAICRLYCQKCDKTARCKIP